MNDLISRQAAIEMMAKWDWQELYLPIHFKQLLEDLPPAQPGLIRCKNCKYADEYYHCSYTTWWNSPDDFCSRAEMRGGKNENTKTD